MNEKIFFLGNAWRMKSVDPKLLEGPFVVESADLLFKKGGREVFFFFFLARF